MLSISSSVLSASSLLPRRPLRSPLSSYFKFPFRASIFLPPLSSLRIFLSSSLQSILLNSCHTERFCSLSRASGEMLCQAERKEAAAVSLQGC